MNERQFQHMLQNRRRWAPRALFGEVETGRMLRGAAEKVRRRQELETAWRKTADPRWLERTSIESVRENVLTITVNNAALLHELARQAERLRRDLSLLGRPLRELRFQLPRGVAPHDGRPERNGAKEAF